MKVDVKKVTFHHYRHKTLVEVLHTPTKLERWLGYKQKTEFFIGHKHTWSTFPGMKPLTKKADLDNLAAIEQKFKYLEHKIATRR